MHRFEKRGDIDAAAAERGGHGHHLVLRLFAVRCPGVERDVRIPGGIDDTFGADGLPPGLALRDHTLQSVAFHDRRDGQAVENGNDTGFLEQRVGHDLEHVGVQQLSETVVVLEGGSHLGRPVLELHPNPAGVDGVFCPVPGDRADHGLGDVASETAVALDDHGVDAFSRSR